MSTTMFQPEPRTYRDDDGPDSITLKASFDGYPVTVKVEYVDALSALKMLKRLGTDESIYKLAQQLVDDDEGSEEE
ncbi:hypothetical protein [Rhodococcus erythropolis]|uniref:hypothetical protein n=1 Tax=Rhodococcus erythropolis TaxID=1833 RepID=UPI00366BB838